MAFTHKGKPPSTHLSIYTLIKTTQKRWTWHIGTKKDAKPMQENHDKNNASAPPSLPQAKRTLRINAHQLFSIMKAFGPRKQSEGNRKEKEKPAQGISQTTMRLLNVS